VTSDERGAMGAGANLMRRLPQGAVSFDAMGRRVLNPASGIFFVKSGTGAKPVRVVLAR